MDFERSQFPNYTFLLLLLLSSVIPPIGKYAVCLLRYVSFKRYSIKAGPGSWARAPGPGPGWVMFPCTGRQLVVPSHVVKTSMNLYSGVRTVGIAINDGLAWLSSWVVPAVTVCIASQAASRLS